jgi:hypothetical protein
MGAEKGWGLLIISLSAMLGTAGASIIKRIIIILI